MCSSSKADELVLGVVNRLDDELDIRRSNSYDETREPEEQEGEEEISEVAGLALRREKPACAGARLGKGASFLRGGHVW